MSEWLSFWKAAEMSKEEDILECEEYYGTIANNGDFTFMWEESWTPVKLSGEHLGFKWRIKERKAIGNSIDITKHIGGILCACYDCRSKKGYKVRKSIPRKVEISPNYDLSVVSEPNYQEYELQQYAVIQPLGQEDKQEYFYEYILKH